MESAPTGCTCQAMRSGSSNSTTRLAVRYGAPAWRIFISKTAPFESLGVDSSLGPRTMPDPSRSWCRLGFARIAKIAAAGASIVLQCETIRPLFLAACSLVIEIAGESKPAPVAGDGSEGFRRDDGEPSSRLRPLERSARPRCRMGVRSSRASASASGDIPARWRDAGTDR